MESSLDSRWALEPVGIDGAFPAFYFLQLVEEQVGAGYALYAALHGCVEALIIADGVELHGFHLEGDYAIRFDAFLPQALLHEGKKR